MTAEVLPITEGHHGHSRANDSVIIGLLHEVLVTQKTMQADLDKHQETETDELAKEVAKLMEKAFPKGDAEAHRRYHEAEIAKIEASAAFWRKMREELTKWGLIGFIGWLIVMTWQGFLQGPHK